MPRSVAAADRQVRACSCARWCRPIRPRPRPRSASPRRWRRRWSGGSNRSIRSSSPWASGRTLRAAVEQLPPMDCPQHKIVSLVGNIAPDGSASFYDVILRIADAVKAPHYPMPLPVIASTVHEKALFLRAEIGDQRRSISPGRPTSPLSASARWATARRWCRTASSRRRDARADEGRRGRRDRRLGLRCQGQADRGPHQRPGRERRARSARRPRLVVAVAMGVFKAKALKAALTGQVASPA